MPLDMNANHSYHIFQVESIWKRNGYVCLHLSCGHGSSDHGGRGAGGYSAPRPQTRSRRTGKLRPLRAVCKGSTARRRDSVLHPGATPRHQRNGMNEHWRMTGAPVPAVGRTHDHQPNPVRHSMQDWILALVRKAARVGRHNPRRQRWSLIRDFLTQHPEPHRSRAPRPQPQSRRETQDADASGLSHRGTHEDVTRESK